MGAAECPPRDAGIRLELDGAATEAQALVQSAKLNGGPGAKIAGIERRAVQLAGTAQRCLGLGEPP